MRVPLTEVSANELVEQYIGTAYDNVKAVAGILGDVTNVASNAADISAAAALADNVDAVVANEANINAVVANVTDIITVADNIDNVNIVAGDTIPINTVAGDTIPINTVAGNEADINTVAGISGSVSTLAGIAGDLTTLNANEANLNTVAADIANINTTANDIANVNAVASNETNIDYVADNFVAISVAVSSLTMTETSLSLVLDNNPEVTGVNYNTVKAAYDYALTRVQANGWLNITVPASTTISETERFVMDLSRFNISITGGSVSSSVISHSHSSTGKVFETEGGGDLILSNIKFLAASATGTGIKITGAKNLSIEDVDFSFPSASTGVQLEGINYGVYADVDIEAVGIGFSITQGGYHYFERNVDIICNSTGAATGLNMTRMVQASGGYTVNFPNHVSGTATGGFLNTGSQFIKESAISITGADVDYDPVIDTTDNYYSRFITVA